MNALRERLKKADLPDLVRKEAERELDRMERLPSASPDRSVLQSYLELVLELPWRKKSEEVLDIAKTRQVLDEDHFDLKDVKERILEQLGVLKLNPAGEISDSLLCRASRCGEDIARKIDCPCNGAAV